MVRGYPVLPAEDGSLVVAVADMPPLIAERALQLGVTLSAWGTTVAPLADVARLADAEAKASAQGSDANARREEYRAHRAAERALAKLGQHLVDEENRKALERAHASEARIRKQAEDVAIRQAGGARVDDPDAGIPDISHFRKEAS